MSDAALNREADQLDGAPLPEEQTSIFGHHIARQSLYTSLENRRLPSAILMHGPRGIGKASLAFDLARAIFAQTGDEDLNRVHEQVAALGHPNLGVLRREPRDTKGFYTVIRVAEVRKMTERLHKTRGRPGYRVAIIDSIDDCNVSAANALLKILEEPPAETVFVLISHRPGQLLPTIKSRCQSVPLRPLADTLVTSVLGQIRPEANIEAIAHAVSLAGGRPRRGIEALAMADESALSALKIWLGAPVGPSAAHLGIADKLTANPGGSEIAFAREIIFDWLAEEAKSAALGGRTEQRRLASVTELWDKAHAQFDDADAINLDMRQALVGILDEIRLHIGRMTQVSEIN